MYDIIKKDKGDSLQLVHHILNPKCQNKALELRRKNFPSTKIKTANTKTEQSSIIRIIMSAVQNFFKIRTFTNVHNKHIDTKNRLICQNLRMLSNQ